MYTYIRAGHRNLNRFDFDSAGVSRCVSRLVAKLNYPGKILYIFGKMHTKVFHLFVLYVRTLDALVLAV